MIVVVLNCEFLTMNQVVFVVREIANSQLEGLRTEFPSIAPFV
jgi:hypothetical protein